ncbi:MAG: radical SAM protein [bacterium]
MKFQNILLVIPPIYNIGQPPLYPQAGIGYIAEALNQNKINYEVIDMRFGYKIRDLIKRINRVNFDLMGVSMTSLGYQHTYNIINEVKIRFPDIKIAAGGPHLSTIRERVLEGCTGVDYGFVLEGEESFIELCQGKDLKEIKGLLFRDEDRVVYNGDRNFIENLNGIGFPKYYKFELDRYFSKALPIISSRGCPYSCIYCPVKTTIGKRFRVRSAENVVEELRYWYSKGYRDFQFQDDNFTLYPDRVYEICELILKAGMKDLRLTCDNGVRADKVDRHLLETMKKTGFYLLAFGVEAGNDRILKRLKKGERIEKIEKAIKDATELGYKVNLFFLLGSPGEGWEDIEDSIELSLKYPVTQALFYNLIPFPGTELFEWVSTNNYFVRKPEDYLNDTYHQLNIPLFQTPELPFFERKKAFAYAQKVSLRIRRMGIERAFSPKAGKHLSRFIAYFASSKIFEWFYDRNPFFRKIAESVKRRSLSR